MLVNCVNQEKQILSRSCISHFLGCNSSTINLLSNIIERFREERHQWPPHAKESHCPSAIQNPIWETGHLTLYPWWQQWRKSTGLETSEWSVCPQERQVSGTLGFRNQRLLPSLSPMRFSLLAFQYFGWTNIKSTAPYCSQFETEREIIKSWSPGDQGQYPGQGRG